MNASKSLALVLAIVITAAGMSGIARYSNAAADAARRDLPTASHTTLTPTWTLPTIEVRPTREQLRELGLRKVTRASGATLDSSMPFYSFAHDAAGA